MAVVDRLLASQQPLPSLLDAARAYLQSQETTVAVAAVLIQKAAALFSSDECQDAIAIVRMIGYYGLPQLDTLLSLFELASNFDAAAIPVIEHIPSLCDSTTVEIAMEKLQSLLQDDRTCLVPVLATIAMLPLTPNLHIQARQMTLQSLEIVSVSDLPAVFRALLLACTTKASTVEVIAAIRQQTSSIDSDVVFPLVQVVGQHCRSSTRTAKLFLLAFADDRGLSPFDAFLILSFMSVRRFRAQALTTLKDKLSEPETTDRILDLFRTCSDTCESFASSFVSLGSLLLHSPPVSQLTASVAGRILRQSFQSFPGARLEIVRFLLSSLASSCDVHSSRAASRTLLVLVQSCSDEMNTFSQHVMETLYHAPYFTTEILHFVSLAVALMASYNSMLVSNCLIVCQKNILSECDDQRRTGYALGSHLVKSGKLNDSDRDDIMIWSLRSDSQKPCNELPSPCFLDFLVHVADCLTEDEIEHILNVHLYSQLASVLNDKGHPFLSTHVDLTPAALLIRALATLCSQISVFLPIRNFLKEYSDAKFHLLCLTIILESRPTSEFSVTAVPFCLELFEAVSNDSTDSQTFASVPFVMNTCIETLVSPKVSLSTSHQSVLLYRIFILQTSSETLSPFGHIGNFTPASCTSDAVPSFCELLKWILSSLKIWQSSDTICFCLALRIVLLNLESSKIEPLVLQLFDNEVSTSNERNASMLAAYSFFFNLLQKCAESCSFFTVLEILQSLTPFVPKAHELGNTCFRMAKTVLLKQSDDPRLAGFFNFIPLNKLAPDSFLACYSKPSLSSRQHLLNMIKQLRLGDAARDFVLLSCAGLALAHQTEVFPFVLQIARCVFEFAADDGNARHRSFTSLTRNTLPTIIDFLQRVCLLAIHRVSLIDCSRSDFCHVKEYLCVFLFLLRQHGHSRPKATQMNSIKLVSDLHLVLESCIKLTSSKESCIPKKSIAPLASLIVGIIEETRQFTKSLRLERNYTTKVAMGKMLPYLMRRVEDFESRLATLMGPFQFHLETFNAEKCLDQFSLWWSQSKQKGADSYVAVKREGVVCDLVDHGSESDVLITNTDELRDEDFIARFYQESGDETIEVGETGNSDRSVDKEIDIGSSSEKDDVHSDDSDLPIRPRRRRRNMV